MRTLLQPHEMELAVHHVACQQRHVQPSLPSEALKGCLCCAMRGGGLSSLQILQSAEAALPTRLEARSFPLLSHSQPYHFTASNNHVDFRSLLRPVGAQGREVS